MCTRCAADNLTRNRRFRRAIEPRDILKVILRVRAVIVLLRLGCSPICRLRTSNAHPFFTWQIYSATAWTASTRAISGAAKRRNAFSRPTRASHVDRHGAASAVTASLDSHSAVVFCVASERRRSEFRFGRACQHAERQPRASAAVGSWYQLLVQHNAVGLDSTHFLTAHSLHRLLSIPAIPGALPLGRS